MVNRRCRIIVGLLAVGFVASCDPAVEPNLNPIITALTADATAIEVGGSVTVAVTANDPDAGTMTYTWSATGGTITGTSATISWMAPQQLGTFTIQVIVTDDQAGADTSTVDVGTEVSHLYSAAVTTGPTLDGAGSDAAWGSALELAVSAGATAAYTNAFGVVDVSMKSVHTATDLYVMAVWTDPSATEDVTRKAWSYAGGAWSRASTNEDRFYLMFDGGDNGTEGASCASMCHQPGAGLMGTTGGGHVDVWHWKATRTNPIGLADDKWWDATGRVSDAKTVSAYSDNLSVSLNFPLYAGPTDANGNIIIPNGGTTADLTPFDSTNAALQANTYPGYFLNLTAAAAGSGSRHDIKAVGVYNAGVWTIELQRALNTTNVDDVAFAVGDTTDFSMAVTDNSGGNHSGAGVLKVIIQ